MSADLQQTKRPTVETKRINKTLTIPAFSLTGFWSKQALKTKDYTVRGIRFTDLGFDLSNAFTVEFWAFTHFTPAADYQTLYVNSISDGGGGEREQIKIYLDSGIFRVTVLIGTITYTVSSSAFIPIGQWFHIAVTYNGQFVNLYLNGELVGNDELIGPLDTALAAYDTVLFSDYVDSSGLFFGYIDEVRIWSVEKTQTEILWNKDKPVPNDATGLLFYTSFDDASVSGTDLIINERVSDVDITFVAATVGVELSTENTAPLILGGSFVVAEVTTNLDKNVSLLFPVEAPDDATNYALCVSWVDEEDQFHRKMLFKPLNDDIDLNPYPEMYAGEKLTDGFKLEIMVVDGESSIVSSGNITLQLSDTTLPTSGTDHASVEAETLTVDSSIAESLPLSSFPLAFSSQQTFE